MSQSSVQGQNFPSLVESIKVVQGFLHVNGTFNFERDTSELYIEQIIMQRRVTMTEQRQANAAPRSRYTLTTSTIWDNRYYY